MKQSWKMDYHRPIDRADLEKLIDRAKKIDTNSMQRYGQDRLVSLLSFLWIYGPRINEALKITPEDFEYGDDDNVEVLISYSKRNDREGRKHRVFASRDTPFMNNVLQQVERTEDESEIWGKSDLERYGYHNAYFAVAEISLIGTSLKGPNISFHQFRHTRATKLANKVGNAFQLKIFFGWSSIESAKSYVEESGVAIRDLGDKIGD